MKINTDEVLPDCRQAMPTARKWAAGLAYIPIFCGNCHRAGPYVPEENTNFAFWLCSSCEQSWGQLAGTMCIPDEKFWEVCKQAQLEKYGRELSAEETVEALKDDNNPLAKLAKDRK